LNSVPSKGFVELLAIWHAVVPVWNSSILLHLHLYMYFSTFRHLPLIFYIQFRNLLLAFSPHSYLFFCMPVLHSYPAISYTNIPFSTYVLPCVPTSGLYVQQPPYVNIEGIFLHHSTSRTSHIRMWNVFLCPSTKPILKNVCGSRDIDLHVLCVLAVEKQMGVHAMALYLRE
jgi:hypothetical protein